MLKIDKASLSLIKENYCDDFGAMCKLLRTSKWFISSNE
jgi:hypothetical protein